MSLDHIKLSQQEKEQLSRLKRHTGIEHWNILCRWAFNVSLKEPSAPPLAIVSSDSNVEMTWKTFGGEYADLYFDLLQLRCAEDNLGIDEETLYTQFRLHLKRGIGYLSANKSVRSISDLVEMSLNNK